MKANARNLEKRGLGIFLLSVALSGCFPIREDKGPEDPYHFLDRIESADHPTTGASRTPQSAPLQGEKLAQATPSESSSEPSPTQHTSFKVKERRQEEENGATDYNPKLNPDLRKTTSAPPSAADKSLQKNDSEPPKGLQSNMDRLNRMRKTASIAPGLGITFLDYILGGVTTVSEVMLTPKISGSIALSPHWNLGANLYYTALSLWSSHPESELSILGANLRAGYTILLSDWEIMIMAGWYYTNTFGFGYHDVQGPALYPAVRTIIGDLEVSFYIKFSPILSDDSFLSLTNSELAFGADCVIARTKNGNPIRVTLDIARLSVALPDGSAESKSYTLGGSFSF